MAAGLKKADTEQEAADLLRRDLARVFPFDGLTVCRRDNSGCTVSHSWGTEDIRPGMRFGLEDGLGGWIVKHGAALVIKDMAEGIRRARFSRQENPKHAFRSFLGVPLGEGKPAAGCVCLESRSPAAYDDKSKEILWPMVELWETISAGIRLKQLLSENKS
jgi:transcriptional regulator with GAF, ATPase, and Fis domain